MHLSSAIWAVGPLHKSAKVWVLLYQNPNLKSETFTGFLRCLSKLQGPPTDKLGLPSATPVLQSAFTAHPSGFNRPLVCVQFKEWIYLSWVREAGNLQRLHWWMKPQRHLWEGSDCAGRCKHWWLGWSPVDPVSPESCLVSTLGHQDFIGHPQVWDEGRHSPPAALKPSLFTQTRINNVALSPIAKWRQFCSVTISLDNLS